MTQLSPAILAYIAGLREEVADPTLLCTVIEIRGGGSYTLWQDDIDGKTDQEIADFLVQKHREHSKK